MGQPAVHTTPAPRAGVTHSSVPAPRAGVAHSSVPALSAGVAHSSVPALSAGVAHSSVPAPSTGVAVSPVPAAGAGVSNNQLEAVLQRLEQHLDDLQTALGARDMPCIELHAGELQRALVQAIDRFHRAARVRTTPLELRRRLALAGAQVAAQRDALARATAALDRAIDVLVPSSATAVYSASGTHGPRRNATALEA
jgi:hypothetical protein